MAIPLNVKVLISLLVFKLYVCLFLCTHLDADLFVIFGKVPTSS